MLLQLELHKLLSKKLLKSLEREKGNILGKLEDPDNMDIVYFVLNRGDAEKDLNLYQP